MTICYKLLEAKYPCTRTNNATINVFSQEDISLEVNNNMQIKLHLAFKIYGGIVALSTLDERLVPVKEIYMYMTSSSDSGLVVTLYNPSYSRYDGKARYRFLILRCVE